MPGATVIFDAFELGFVGVGRQNGLEGEGLARLRSLDIKQREVSLARACDMTWTSSRADERWLTMAAPGLMVEVVPPVCDVTRDGPGFHERAGVVVVGDLWEPSRRDAESFFRRQVLPRVRLRYPDLSYEGLRVDRLSEPSAPGAVGPALVPWRGLRQRLAVARVLVAPFRFSSGVPFEVVYAMAQGVPVVTTTVAAEGLDLRDADSVLVADTATGLAERVAAVLTEPLLWQRLAKSGQELIAKRFSSEAARERVDRILTQLVPDPSRPADTAPVLDATRQSPAGPGLTSLGDNAPGGSRPQDHLELGRIASTLATEEPRLHDAVHDRGGDCGDRLAYRDRAPAISEDLDVYSPSVSLEGPKVSLPLAVPPGLGDRVHA